MTRRGRPPRAEIDLGLELLSLARKPGEALTVEDIAAWAGCSPSYIHALEKSALRKLREFVNAGLARR